MEPTSVKMEILRKITKNFAEELVLGKGAYGKVYRVRFRKFHLWFPLSMRFHLIFKISVISIDTEIIAL